MAEDHNTTLRVMQTQPNGFGPGRVVRMIFVGILIAVPVVDFVIRHMVRDKPFELIEVLIHGLWFVIAMIVFDWRGAWLLLTKVPGLITAWRGKQTPVQGLHRRRRDGA